MKRVKLEDLKPNTHYWLLEDGELYPIKTWQQGSMMTYMYIGNECESVASDTEVFYELKEPNLEAVQVFNKQYDGESIVDLSRDISECFDERFNEVMKGIPEMKETPGFYDGEFVVSVNWVPNEQA